MDEIRQRSNHDCSSGTYSSISGNDSWFVSNFHVPVSRQPSVLPYREIAIVIVQSGRDICFRWLPTNSRVTRQSSIVAFQLCRDSIVTTEAENVSPLSDRFAPIFRRETYERFNPFYTYTLSTNSCTKSVYILSC